MKDHFTSIGRKDLYGVVSNFDIEVNGSLIKSLFGIRKRFLTRFVPPSQTQRPLQLRKDRFLTTTVVTNGLNLKVNFLDLNSTKKKSSTAKR